MKHPQAAGLSTILDWNRSLPKARLPRWLVMARSTPVVLLWGDEIDISRYIVTKEARSQNRQHEEWLKAQFSGP
jgi:hypothetical protein